MKPTTGATINFPNDLTPCLKMNASSSLPACPAGGTYADANVGNSLSLFALLRGRRDKRQSRSAAVPGRSNVRISETHG